MRIKTLYSPLRPVFSLEIFPPKEEALINDILNGVKAMSELRPDFISVTYGASGSGNTARTLQISRFIKESCGIEPLSHLTCINSPASEVKAAIESYRDGGIENVLALRGDIAKAAEVKRDFLHASDLAITIAKYSDIDILGACYPEGHADSPNLDADIENLKYKIGAGVGALITQLFFDNSRFYKFIDKIHAKNITVPISAGVMPIVNKRQIERVVSLSGASLPHKFTKMIAKYEGADLFKAGVDYAAAQINDLTANGCDGIHLYTMNNPRVAFEVYAQIKEGLKR